MSILYKGYGPPTDHTAANVGDRYLDLDAKIIYECTDFTHGEPVDYGFVDIHQAHENKYQWKAVKPDNTLAITNACSLFSDRVVPSNMIDASARLDLLDNFILDTSKCSNFSYMFAKCSKLVEVPNFDTSMGDDYRYMFDGCRALKTVPDIDFSRATLLYCTFNGCMSLLELPTLDVRQATSLSSFCARCNSLTTIQMVNTGNVQSFNAAFIECINLVSISELDLNRASDVGAMFYNNYALTNLVVNNVRISLTIGSGTSWGHLLTVDSLVHTIKELCKVTTQQTLTMGSANLAKIADLYCKVTDDTTNKIEMELCESTDEGAITVAEYATLKNWVFA